jgi:hypothetical protein
MQVGSNCTIDTIESCGTGQLHSSRVHAQNLNNQFESMPCSCTGASEAGCGGEPPCGSRQKDRLFGRERLHRPVRLAWISGG